MPEDLKFRFYEATSNEDAGPYLSDTRMIVCDGCGGAGGFYHHVDPELINSFEKIKSLVLPEEEDESSDEFLKEFFEPVYTEPDKDRTSAFWASRIVLSNFIYCFTDKDIDEAKAKKRAIRGLAHIAKTLDFKLPSIGGKTLLPTTFVEVSLSYLDTDKPSADIFWAGDSRAYIFNEEGLKKLTIDDEDETGAINNLFCIHKDLKTKLHYYKKDFKKKCIIFVCSDGLFDNFSDLDFEYILSALMQESNSIQEYHDKLVAFYNANKGDDCTMAFNAIGFKDFNEMKEHFKSRALEVDTLWKQEHHEFKESIKLKNNPGLYDDLFQKTVVRTNDKKRDILAAIANEFKNNGSCNLVNDDLLEEIEKANNKEKEKALLDLEKAKNDHIEDIYKAVSVLLDSVPLNSIFVFEKGKDYQDKILKELGKEQYRLIEAKNRMNEFEKDRIQYMNLCDTLLSHTQRIVSILQRANFLGDHALKDNYESFKEKLVNGRYNLSDIKPLISLVATMRNDPSYEEEFSKYADYAERKVQYDKDRQMVHEKTLEIIKGLEPLFKNVGDLYQIIRRIGTSESIQTILKFVEEAEEKVNKVSGAINAETIINYLTEAGAEKLVEIRLKLGETTTCIDRLYNSNSLITLIKYYKAKNTLSDDFEAFYEKYVAFNQNVDSLFEDINNKVVDI